MDRRKGWLWIVGGAFLALLAGILVFMMITRATAQPSQGPASPAEGPRVRVLVAAREIPQHTVIEETDVSVEEVPAEDVPDEAMLSVESALGKIAQRTISSGEILVANMLASYASGSGEKVAFTTLGDQVVLAREDQVLLAIPPSLDLMSKEFLVIGNHVDVLVSLPPEAERAGPEGPAPEEELSEGAQSDWVTAYTIQNTEIVAVKYEASKDGEEKGETRPSSGDPRALLIALDPQDALVLKHLIDRGGAIIGIALRAPTSDQLFDTQPVDRDYLYDRYRLAR